MSNRFRYRANLWRKTLEGKEHRIRFDLSAALEVFYARGHILG